MSLLELRDFSTQLREKIRPIHEELYGKVLAEVCEEIIDTRSLQPNNCKELEEKRYGRALGMRTPLSIAEVHIRERQRKVKTTQERDSAVDFDCELCVIPIKGKLLAIPFTEQNEFLAVINAMEEVSEYGYWDNSDQPEEISRSRWDRRRDNWEEALPGIGVPSENCFTIQITRDSLFHQPVMVLHHIKSVPDRAKIYARNKIVDSIFRRRKIELGEDFDPYHELQKASEYINAPEGQIELEQITQELILLLKEITLDVLCGNE